MQTIKRLKTPVNEEDIRKLQVGDIVYLSGQIYCGRDTVLPKIIEEIESETLDPSIDLQGNVVFHTAVSSAGLGPTSSNKVEIEASMIPLSKSARVKIHLGKGKLKQETICGLFKENAVYAIIPPVTALLGSKTERIECVAHEELGMEALYRILVRDFPIIIAGAGGRSIYK